MKQITSIILLILLSTAFAFGQKENRLIREGNKQYESEDFREAEIDYRKSLLKNSGSIPGRYNLGNSLYKQNNWQEAVLAFDSVRNSNPDEKVLSDSYYNLGNALLKMAMDTANTFQEALPASIEAYKNALRSNPEDTAAKYNLSYAMNLMDQQQDQQQQQQQQDQNQDQNEEQEQEQEQQQQQQDEQEQEQEQEQQQQENQQNQNDQQQQQKQQQQPKEISKEDAQRMLEALQNDEKSTLEKLKLQQVKGNRYKSEKDW